MKTSFTVRQSAKAVAATRAITNTVQLHAELSALCERYGVTFNRPRGEKPREVRADARYYQADAFAAAIQDIRQRWTAGRTIVAQYGLGRRWASRRAAGTAYCRAYQFYVDRLTLLEQFAGVATVTETARIAKAAPSTQDQRRAQLALMELQCYVDGVITELHYASF